MNDLAKINSNCNFRKRKFLLTNLQYNDDGTLENRQFAVINFLLRNQK